jgi:hypothetical protein
VGSRRVPRVRRDVVGGALAAAHRGPAAPGGFPRGDRARVGTAEGGPHDPLAAHRSRGRIAAGAPGSPAANGQTERA